MDKKLTVRNLTLAECLIDAKEWMRLYLDGKHNELTVAMIEILKALSKPEHCFAELNPARRYFVNQLASSIGFYFTQLDFSISDELAVTFAKYNVVLQNIFSMSDFKSSDIFIRLLLPQPNNLAKILILYNARCNIQIPYSALHEKNNDLTGSWYGAYMHRNSPYTQLIQENLTKHLLHPPQSLPATFEASLGYFECTYANVDIDKNYKKILNDSYKRVYKNVSIKNKPNKNKNQIAILTSNWIAGKALYKSMYVFLEALSKSFDLTLVHLGASNYDKLEKSIFKKTLFVYFDSDNQLNYESIRFNDFNMVIYPEIGSDYEGRILSNTRIAPHQVAMYGFPVSSFGSSVDFFIGGQEIENFELAPSNYSEQLVAIKGIGAIPIKNDFIHKKQVISENGNIFFLGSFPKLSYENIDAMRLIKQSALSSVKFTFALQYASDYQAYIPASEFIKSELGGNTDIYVSLPYEQYMELIAKSSFCIDAYPFGGFNTIVDALHLGKPVVTWEGTKAYNRLASAVLRRLGLNELIATSQEEYVSIATRLLNNKAFYDDICARIAALDIDALLYTREDELEDFVHKIKMIINGEINRV